MSDLTPIEKRKLERLFRMDGGYVLNFSNRTFDEFFVDTIGRSVYDAKYDYGSGSKANQMRGFWREADNPLVARLLHALIELVESETLCDDTALIADCRKIVARLAESAPIPESEAIRRIADEHDLEVVAQAVLDLIERNELVAGLDRLHTFTTAFIRSLCEQRGLNVERGKALHSLFGEYVRSLHQAGHLESKMTASILKAFNAPLDAFNDVRNNQSLAHDNALLNHEEAKLIFQHVTSALRFLRDLERRLKRSAKVQIVRAPSMSDDEIPF